MKYLASYVGITIGDSDSALYEGDLDVASVLAVGRACVSLWKKGPQTGLVFGYIKGMKYHATNKGITIGGL